MNREQVDGILAELETAHPTIQVELQEMNSAHTVQWYQLWLWNDQTKQTPILLQSPSDWERFKVYRALLIQRGGM